MNNVTNEQKSSAIKTLAIIGFITAIVAGLWITVQVVRYIPTAFTSLASIADSLYGTPKGIAINAEKDVVNSGEAFRFSFKPVRGEGSYAFSYRCVDGISAETRDAMGDIVRIACEDEVDIASGRLLGEQGAEILFTSEKKRFTDVPFTLAFYKDGADEASSQSMGMVTIVNATIPERGMVASAEDTQKPMAKPAPAAPKPTVTPKPTYTTPKPTTTYVQKVPVTTTSFPISNPYGYTDLDVSLVVPSTMDAGEEETIQVMVKNIGTKTSKDWKVEVSYPAEGDDTFTSKAQAPLLPGERATMTIRFTTTDRDGTKTVKAKVTTSGDSKNSNNSVSRSVRIDD
jgi:hypothetical protein